MMTILLKNLAASCEESSTVRNSVYFRFARCCGSRCHDKPDLMPPHSPEAPDGGRGRVDQRILGSGDFVSEILQHAKEDAIKIDALMLDIRKAPSPKFLKNNKCLIINQIKIS